MLHQVGSRTWNMVAKQHSSTRAQQHSNNSLHTLTTLSTEAAAMRATQMHESGDESCVLLRQILNLLLQLRVLCSGPDCMPRLSGIIGSTRWLPQISSGSWMKRARGLPKATRMPVRPPVLFTHCSALRGRWPPAGWSWPPSPGLCFRFRRLGYWAS